MKEERRTNICITFLVFRCRGAKEIAGKPQERGEVNIPRPVARREIKRRASLIFFTPVVSCAFACRCEGLFCSFWESSSSKNCVFYVS